MKMNRLMALLALVSSAALAQQQPGDGNIPAPDLFDSQIVVLKPVADVATCLRPRWYPWGDMESVAGHGHRNGDNVQIIGNKNHPGRSRLHNSYRGQQLRPGRSGQLRPLQSAGQGAIATDVAEGFTAKCCRSSRPCTATRAMPDEYTGTAGAVSAARAALCENAEADDYDLLSPACAYAAQDAQYRRCAGSGQRRRGAEYNAIAAGADPPGPGCGGVDGEGRGDTSAIEDYNDRGHGDAHRRHEPPWTR